MVDSVGGGSAWGAGSVVGGQGQLAVKEEDKAVAFYQGQSFSTVRCLSFRSVVRILNLGVVCLLWVGFSWWEPS